MINYYKSTSQEHVELQRLKTAKYDQDLKRYVTNAWYGLPNTPKFLLGDSYKTDPSLKFSATEVAWVHKNGQEYQLAGDQAQPQTIVTLGKRVDIPQYRIYARDRDSFQETYTSPHEIFRGGMKEYTGHGNGYRTYSNTKTKWKVRTRVVGSYTLPQGAQTNEMLATLRWTTSGSFYGSYIPKSNKDPGSKVEWVTLTEDRYYAFAYAVDSRPVSLSRYGSYLHMGVFWMLRLKAGKLEVITQDFISEVRGHTGWARAKNIYGDGYEGDVNWTNGWDGDYINTPSITLQVNILPRTTY